MSAQLNWLTVPEAESLVELVPDVEATLAAETAPSSQIRTGTTESLSRCARVARGPRRVCYSGGQATCLRAREHPTPSGFDQSCLAVLDAFRAGHPNRQDVISVKPFGQSILGQVQFDVGSTSPRGHFQTSALYTVDVTTARVLDDAIGVDVHSADLGRLTGQLMTIHLPPLLSREDVTAIALAIPPFGKAISDRFLRGSTYYGANGEVAQVGLSNTCVVPQVANEPVLVVNIHTGAVFDEKYQAVLSTAESNQAARRALDALQKRRAEAQRAVDTQCSRVANEAGNHP